MSRNMMILEGIRVLDMTRVLAGPYCGMLLADLGADVIKIEVPGQGDDSRHFGPFVNGESSYFMNLNRNKRGMTIDLKRPEGKTVFKQLVAKSDVIIENFRPGTMEKLGLHYDALSEINQGIVYGAVSGFGQNGFYKDRAGYDIIGQAMGGMMSVTGWPDGSPTRTGTAIADVLAGLSVTIGILAALNSRTRTGKGQMVDVSLVDSVISSLEIILQIYLSTGVIPDKIGNRYESTYPYDSFKAMDGELVIGAGNNKLWLDLCKVMGREDLVTDERFDDNSKRVARHEELKLIIEEWTMQRTADENVEMILNGGVPSSTINTIDKVVNDPHLADERNMIVEMEHPKAGKMKIIGSHIKMSNMEFAVRMPSPLLGEHNYEILHDVLNMMDDEIKELEIKRAI